MLHLIYDMILWSFLIWSVVFVSFGLCAWVISKAMDGGKKVIKKKKGNK